MHHSRPPASGSLSSSPVPPSLLPRSSLISSPAQPSKSALRPARQRGRRRHEDPVRLVRRRGGHGGVLRGRGGAVRALRRGDPRRQQARQQAPEAPAGRARRQAPALRHLPGEGRLHLLRRGQGALLPRLRRAHPRPRHALREPPALPRHRHPRRPWPRLRLRRRGSRRRPRRRPPRPAQGRLRAPARRRRAARPLAAAVPAAGLGRRRAPAVLGLRVQRQAAQGLASRLQGAGVVHRGHGALPRPRAQGRQGDHGGARVLRLPGGRRRCLLQAEQSRRHRRLAPEQEGPRRDPRRRGLLHRA
ncbi:hypothetical protein ACQJBY_054671 [Aegilops geniculata]